MSITLIFLAVVATFVIWWLRPQNLGANPSLVQGVLDDPRPDSPIPSKKLGLWVFLAVISSIFALFTSAYFIRMELNDWTPVPDNNLLWLNTLLLLLGSAAFQRARTLMSKNELSGVKTFMILAGLFTCLFLAGQLWVWQELRAAGLYHNTNPANAFFYVITGVHGIHMIGGLWVWGLTTFKIFNGAEADEIGLSVELCTIYWHYLLLIWLAMFGLLLVT